MTAPPDDAQIKPEIGTDIRRLRKIKRITLQELARSIDRSVGFLSQVERGLSELSVNELQHISHHLGIPLGWFFANEPAPPAERGRIVRAGARRQLGNRETGLVEELLSPDLGGTFEVVRTVIEPGTALTPIRRDTEEAGYLVSGELELWLAERHFHLHAGDSFRLAGEPYRWRNPGDLPTVIIWVIAPPVY